MEDQKSLLQMLCQQVEALKVRIRDSTSFLYIPHYLTQISLKDNSYISFFVLMEIKCLITKDKYEGGVFSVSHYILAN